MKKIVGFAALILALVYTTARAEKIEGVEINRTAQAINFTQSIDMTGYRTAGVQAVYSDGTPAPHTLLSGSNVSTDDVITKSNHNLTTGLKVRYDTTTGNAPGGLTTGTTYYAIKLNESRYSLATSSTNAVAGTPIDITSVPNSTSTYTMTPLALSVGLAGFYWQGSNDNLNFAALNVSSVTYSSAGNSLWEFSPYPYKYLRMNFTGPTNGGIAIKAILIGIEE